MTGIMLLFDFLNFGMVVISFMYDKLKTILFELDVFFIACALDTKSYPIPSTVFFVGYTV